MTPIAPNTMQLAGKEWTWDTHHGRWHVVGPARVVPDASPTGLGFTILTGAVMVGIVLALVWWGSDALIVVISHWVANANW